MSESKFYTEVEMTTLRNEAVELCNNFVASFKSGNAKQANDDLTKLQAKIAEYNDAVYTNVLVDLSKKENPFLEALTVRTYNGKIKLNTKTDKDGNYVSASVDDDEGFDCISLYDLDKYAKADPFTFGHKARWHADMIGMRLPLAAAATKSIGGKMQKFYDAFKLKPDEVTAYESDKELDNAFSVNKLTKLLQEVVDSVIYEATEKPDKKGNINNRYMAQKKDVNYLILTICKTNRTNDIVMPNNATVDKLVTRVISRIVTNGDYEADYAVKSK